MCVFWVEDWGWCIRCFVFGKWMYFSFWTERYLVFWIGSLFGKSLHVFAILYWEVFGKFLHVFGILGWEVYFSEESSAARGRALLMEGNRRHAATMPRYQHSSAGLHLDWIADKSFKLLNIIILQKSLLHVRTTQAASQCGQCKQC